MAEPEKDDSTVAMTQVVNKKTKQDLDKITHQLGSYAIEHGLKQPKKGEVLSRLVELGKQNFDIPGYFKV